MRLILVRQIIIDGKKLVKNITFFSNLKNCIHKNDDDNRENFSLLFKVYTLHYHPDRLRINLVLASWEAHSLATLDWQLV